MRCPICGNSYFSDFLKYPAYKVCLVCNLCCQENFPEKVWEGPEENNGKGPGQGHQMSQDEMNVNINLASALFQMFLPMRYNVHLSLPESVKNLSAYFTD